MRAIEITHSSHSHSRRATVASLTGYNIAGIAIVATCNVTGAWSCSLPVSLSLNDDDGARLDALLCERHLPPHRGLEEKCGGKEKRQSNWKIGKTLCKFYKGAMIARSQRSCRADPTRCCCRRRSARGSNYTKLHCEPHAKVKSQRAALALKVRVIK